MRLLTLLKQPVNLSQKNFTFHFLVAQGSFFPFLYEKIVNTKCCDRMQSKDADQSQTHCQKLIAGASD
jgi:hypothetical protein